MDYTEELTKEELQKISINFRRVSSDFLSCNEGNYHRMLNKFLNFVNNTSIIKQFISNNELKFFDFSKIQEYGHRIEFDIPVDDSDEIAYIYQLLTFVSENEFEIFSLTFMYGSHKAGNKIQSFNNEVIRPLVDHINLHLSEIRIDSGFQNNYGVTNQFTFKKDFRGQINQATNGGTVTAHQNYNESDLQDIKDYSNDFLSALTESQKINSEEKLEIVELLEVTIQSLEKEEPKKSLIKIAMEKIKGITDTVETATTLHIIGTTLYAALANLE